MELPSGELIDIPRSRQQVQVSIESSSALKIIDETGWEEIESPMIIKRNHNE